MAAERKRMRGWLRSAYFWEGGRYGCVLHVVAVAALPFWDHLDRHSLLFQLCTGSVLRRNRPRGPQRSSSEVGSARVVVVPMGRNGHRYRGPSLSALLVGPAAGLADHFLDGGHPHRRHLGNYHVL